MADKGAAVERQNQHAGLGHDRTEGAILDPKEFYKRSAGFVGTGTFVGLQLLAVARGSRRVVIQQGYGDSYNYAPRERYIERRGYYNDQPRPGIGFSAPGVSVGVGVGNDRW